MEYKNKKDLRKLLFQWQNHKNIKRQAEHQSQHNRLQLVLSRREYWSTLQSKNYHNTDETCRFSTSNSKTQLGVSTSLLLCNVSARNAAGPCAAIYTSALAPANLLKFLYKLCKSDRIIIGFTSKKPATSPLLSQAKTANARTYKHTTATRFTEVNDGLCTHSWSSILRYLLDVLLSNRVRKKRNTKQKHLQRR